MSLENPTPIRPAVENGRREKPLTTHEKLREAVSRMAREVNASVEREYGLKNLVDESGRIRPEGYALEGGGIYDEETLADDREAVDALDRYNSAADDPNVRAHFRSKHNIDTPEGIVRRHLKEKEKSRSNQTETAITVLLHTFLRERFLVVRTAVFDDYKHGADNIIVDKETGVVVCAFDEVLRNEGDRQKTPVKIEKVKKQALRGGTEAKYGLSMKDGVIVRDHTKHIPVFYLSLDSDNLDGLAKDLFENFDGDVSRTEKDLFVRLVRSIEEQKSMLEAMPALPSVMKRKLNAFDTSLVFLKNVCEKCGP